MIQLSDLPAELISEILAFALSQHPIPSSILCVNRSFFALSEPILYQHLQFSSILRLSQFSQQQTEIVSPPRTLNVTLAGGAADFYVFQYLRDVLRRCCLWTRGEDSVPQACDRIQLDELSLCLHSHSRSPKLELIYDALSLANPRVFRWNGPDPSHHFSTAIVPAATTYLLRAIAENWTVLQSLTLTNLSFPSDDLGFHGPMVPNKPLLPPILSLRSVYLGQVTMLMPSAIAAMVLQKGSEGLESVRLVDAYRESIWGARIRRGDVEAAAGFSNLEALERLRNVISCEARTERIIGGDRVDGIKYLL